MIFTYENNYYYDDGDEINMISIDEPMEPPIQGPLIPGGPYITPLDYLYYGITDEEIPF